MTQKKKKVEEAPAVEAAAPEEKAFSKAQLLTSKRYAKRIDLLSALLAVDKQYTTAQVDALVESFMKGKVK